MKYFVWFQYLLYFSMLPLFFCCFMRRPDVFDAFCGASFFAAMAIGPLQYLSGLIIWIFNGYKRLVPYLLVSTLMLLILMIKVYAFETPLFDGSLPYILVWGGLVVGVWYIRICRSMMKTNRFENNNNLFV